MKIVVAPDKFKGSLPAAQVAAAIAAGLRSGLARAGCPAAELVTIPVADGGEGTVDTAVAAGFERVPVTAAGPSGDPVRASYARRGEVAVVELAGVCGLARLPGGPCSSRAAPLTASSFGAGEVLRGGRAQHAEPGRTGRGRDCRGLPAERPRARPGAVPRRSGPAAAPGRADDRPGPASRGCDERGDPGMNHIPGDEAGR